jgi:PAS domain S-box-containing protein
MAAFGDLDLKASEERLQLALRGAELAMWDWNIQTGKVHFDERWKAMLGYGPDELPSAFAVWVDRLHPDDADQAQAIVQDHLAGRTPDFTQEFRLRHRDGSWVWVLARGKVIERAPDGAPIRACGTHLDITAQKNAEAERRRLEAQIQHAQKLESLGILAGGIAHDFNNLLVSILGNADLALRDLPESSPLWTGLQEIRTAATRASELTNQMLAYSGKGRFVVESVDLDELVQEIGTLLDASIPKTVTLRYALAGDLPRIEVDATQIRQVVMNLVTNAADARGAAGTITISHRDRWTPRRAT